MPIRQSVIYNLVAQPAVPVVGIQTVAIPVVAPSACTFTTILTVWEDWFPIVITFERLKGSMIASICPFPSPLRGAGHMTTFDGVLPKRRRTCKKETAPSE